MYLPPNCPFLISKTCVTQKLEGFSPAMDSDSSSDSLKLPVKY